VKFEISKTSESTADASAPCSRAYLEVEERPDKVIYQINHWFVDLNTLEDLLKLIDEVEQEIIVNGGLDSILNPSIEIYDTYRE
jgi:hypothetical protein